MAACAHDHAALFVFGDKTHVNFGADAHANKLDFRFGPGTHVKLAVLREAELRAQISHCHLPGESQARAIRFAAANAAFLEAGLGYWSPPLVRQTDGNLFVRGDELSPGFGIRVLEYKGAYTALLLGAALCAPRRGRASC
jgi:hypothetical protein